MNFRHVIFDIEVFPEWWCIVSKTLDKKFKLVIRSDDKDYKNHIYNMIGKTILFGFNIKGYDLKILNAIVNGLDPYRVYEVSQSIINNDEDNFYNSYKYWFDFMFCDLYDDWMYGGLKDFESNRGLSVKESDIEFNKTNLTEDEKQSIIAYCDYDVDATIKLYEYRKAYIETKQIVGEMFNLDPIVCYKSTNAKLTALVLNAYKTKRPIETKYTIPSRIKNYVESSLPDNILSIFETFDYDGKEFKLFDNTGFIGVGGLHSVLSDSIIARSSEDSVLINFDAFSYYPAMMDLFNFVSRNAKNPEVIGELYRRRQELKIKLKTVSGKVKDRIKKEIAAIKLIINTAYGAMKNEYNKLYDPFQADNVCYTGQILLLALANNFYNNLDCKVIQTNTDGILLRLRRNELEKARQLVTRFESETGIIIEEEAIDAVFQRDVNNYIQTIGDEYIVKGEWCKQVIPFEKRELKPLAAPVTHRAIYNYYAKNKPIEETIYECNNLLDFCFTTKTGHSYQKTFHRVGNEFYNINKVNRVIATKNKKYGTLYKFKEAEPNTTKKKPNKDFIKYTNLNYKRLDKIAKIPMNSFIINDEITKDSWVDHIDLQWYIDYSKDRLGELKEVTL